MTQGILSSLRRFSKACAQRASRNNDDPPQRPSYPSPRSGGGGPCERAFGRTPVLSAGYGMVEGVCGHESAERNNHPCAAASSQSFAAGGAIVESIARKDARAAGLPSPAPHWALCARLLFAPRRGLRLISME